MVFNLSCTWLFVVCWFIIERLNERAVERVRVRVLAGVFAFRTLSQAKLPAHDSAAPAHLGRNAQRTAPSWRQGV